MEYKKGQVLQCKLGGTGVFYMKVKKVAYKKDLTIDVELVPSTEKKYKKWEQDDRGRI